MTFALPQTSTRRVPPSHQPWIPHAYQRRSVAHLKASHVAALWLDPGLGKTSIVLEAFRELKAAGAVRTMLVIAPLRVCQAVWRQEAAKWTEFRDLKFSLLHGGKKDERLKDDADVWLINPEGVTWLANKFKLRNVPFDVVTVDEITKFKNHQSERSKAIRPRLRGVRYKWGLTGTPAPNGYMDLFGQFLLLDEGAALGRYITHYRDLYFQVDFDGFTYNLIPGAQKRIEQRLAPYTLCMSADDYLALPPIRDNVISIELSPKARATYNEMKRQMLAELPEGTVTAANAAAVYSKLAQMANGAVYVNNSDEFAVVHDAKIEALEDLLEDLNGQQLLLGYEFNHDIERLKAHFGERLTWLPPGVSDKKVQQIIADWNAGKIPFLAAHPASAGHGLNMQGSSCANVAWFGPIWDLELYQQFIMRVRRQGNNAQRIANHLLIVRDSIDELKLIALADKDTSQLRLKTSLKEILHDAGTQAAGHAAAQQESNMVARLSRQDAPGGGFFGRGAPAGEVQPAPQAQPAPGTDRPQPKGWGAPAGGQAGPGADVQARTEALVRTGEIIAPNGDHAGLTHFSQNVRDAMKDVGAEVKTGPWPGAAESKASDLTAPPITSFPDNITIDPKPTRKRSSKAAETVSPPFGGATPGEKIEILKIAFNDPATTLDDGLEIAKTLLEWVEAV